MYFYLLRMPESDIYKYGITENMEERLQHYRSHNPIDTEVIYLKKLKYKLAKDIEEGLNRNDYLKRVKKRKEWIELNQSDREMFINALDKAVATSTLDLASLEASIRTAEQLVFEQKLRGFGNPYFSFDKIK